MVHRETKESTKEREMTPLNLDDVTAYVNSNIEKFHSSRLNSLRELTLPKVLSKKNPYLFRAKNINVAADFVKDILEAFLSSSEEKLFGDFLEGLALFVAEKTVGGHKSGATGIDMEFENGGIHYFVSIKSGPNWGNSSSQKKQEENFAQALRIMRQSEHGRNVEAVLGICYGKTKTSRVRNYLKVVGQSFWHFISENQNLYTDIVEPLGYKAREHNEGFLAEKAKLVNVLTKVFTERFCDNAGAVNWKRVVEFNSSNM